jgi:uncharacterized protein YjbJ (UPF0337 family)
MLITGAVELLTARSICTELAATTARWQAKQQWGKLTDDDLTRIDGKRDELEGLLQQRYGKSKDDVRKEVDDWLNRI